MSLDGERVSYLRRDCRWDRTTPVHQIVHPLPESFSAVGQLILAAGAVHCSQASEGYANTFGSRATKEAYTYIRGFNPGKSVASNEEETNWIGNYHNE